jgi:hypothetical protein
MLAHLLTGHAKRWGKTMSETNMKPTNPEFTFPEDMDCHVWHYMNLQKFYSMVGTSAIYLCRADRLERFEGTYSRVQVRHRDEFLAGTGHPELIQSEQERIRRDKRRTYISCWCMARCDLDLMWKGYVGNRNAGLAVRSSPRKLHGVCIHHDLQPIGISVVKYFDHADGQCINYFGTPSVFVYKDHHFALDNELRILHWPNRQEPTPDHQLLKCSLDEVIDLIVLSPGTTKPESLCVVQALRDSGLGGIPVEYCRDDRNLEE